MVVTTYLLTGYIRRGEMMIKVFLYVLALSPPPIGERVLVIDTRSATQEEIDKANDICYTKYGINHKVSYIYYNEEANHYYYRCEREKQ